ncbi:MAG: uracil-DNA glycosylase family protein [Desulfobacterales bacterium]|nr:uracil-DNA glycosylase family protein [Pseudomonadota bacterium]MCG2779016.1 uracil-DNA glycosylase family protein [Desulfobacterales bacterium]
MGNYSPEQVSSIIKGYELLDNNGDLSTLLSEISRCDKCSREYSEDRADMPINCLVRPLPLAKLAKEDGFCNYGKQISKEDSSLRELFQENLKVKTVLKKLGSGKFAIGINPWLDRCMLFKKKKKTKLMIIGIDYKHFPVFHKQKKNQNFPIDSYQTKNNIWGPTWQNFWKNLLKQKDYEEHAVNDFLKRNGVFITNSMLCFGGSHASQSHFYGYLECCRSHIAKLVKIVKPKIIVSFGQYGCRNVASMMLQGGNENSALQELSKSNCTLKIMNSIAARKAYREGIKVKYDSRTMTFWPVYQPAYANMHKYKGEYSTLRRLLGLT